MQHAPVWTFGPFEFDPSTFKLRRDGTVVALEPKALDVLRLLLEHAPTVVEKSEIFAVVWKDVAVTDNALTRVIAQLRKALDDDARSPTYIETVATRGYRLVAAVQTKATQPAGSSTQVDTPASPSASSPAGATSAGSSTARRRNPRTAVAAAAGVVIVIAGLVAVSRRPDVPSATEERGPEIARLAALRPTQMTSGLGFDGYPAFSPDGTSIAFSSDRSGAFEIYVQGLASGSTPTALTANGRQNLQPAWSPDGQFIAFHEAVGGGIWVVPSRGGAARRVSDVGARPSWSPDGRLIAFQTLTAVEINSVAEPGSSSTIGVVDVSTLETRAVTSARVPPGPHVVPQWSRDGRRIYFAETPLPFASSGDGGVTSIWSVEVDTGTPRKESQGNRTIAEYALAPDESGAYMVARGSNALWWQPFSPGGDAADARPSGLPILALPTHPALSRDGRRLAWAAVTVTTSLSSVAVPDATGRLAPPQALVLGPGVRATGAAVAPDGRLAYTGSIRGGDTHIWIRDRDGTARQVTVDAGIHLNPFWLAGYQEVAFFAYHNQTAGLNAVDVTTGRERELFPVRSLPRAEGTTPMAVPSLNVIPDPGVTRVAVTLLRDGVPNIWLASLADGVPSGRLAQLTFEEEGASFPRWSPDGRWLSFQCAEGTDTHVCIVDTTDGTRRQLTSEPGQSFIGGWMGSEAILVAARRNGIWNIQRVLRSTGQVQPMTAFSDPRTYVRYPAWDPAHQQVLFERTEQTANIWTVNLP